jgi:hypothetical protein
MRMSRILQGGTKIALSIVTMLSIMFTATAEKSFNYIKISLQYVVPTKHFRLHLGIIIPCSFDLGSRHQLLESLLHDIDLLVTGP